MQKLVEISRQTNNKRKEKKKKQINVEEKQKFPKKEKTTTSIVQLNDPFNGRCVQIKNENFDE